jgi:hypothetical protein
MNASPLRLPDAASIEAVLADLDPASAGDDFVPALARAFPGFEFSMARIDDDYWRDTRSVIRLDGSRLGEMRPWMIQIALGRESEWRAGPIVNPDYRSFDEDELFDPNRLRRVESTDADRLNGPVYRLPDRAGGALVHLRSFLGRCDRIEHARREAERPELERRVIQEIGPDGAREIPFPCPTGLRTCRASCASSKTGSNPAQAHSGCPRIGRSIVGITPTRESGRSASFPRPLRPPRERLLPMPGASVHSVMDRIDAIDRELGLPFGWVFPMTHGHWVEAEIGQAIATGLREQRVRLPDNDAGVLLRWVDEPAGF